MSLKSISHYQITGTLGQGGMGIVYKAIDQKLKRIVAIKTLPPEKQSDEKLKKRLMSEALSACQLNHPNICTISRDSIHFKRSTGGQDYFSDGLTEELFNVLANNPKLR